MNDVGPIGPIGFTIDIIRAFRWHGRPSGPPVGDGGAGRRRCTT